MLHKLNVDDPVWLANVIEYESRKKNIPPRLIVALIHTESSFDKYAVSRLSYHGLMQVKPRVFDERKNIQIGCEILKEKLIKANGDIFKALHYYKGYRIGSKRGKIAVNKTLAIYHRGRI